MRHEGRARRHNDLSWAAEVEVATFEDALRGPHRHRQESVKIEKDAPAGGALVRRNNRRKRRRNPAMEGRTARRWLRDELQWRRQQSRLEGASQKEVVVDAIGIEGGIEDCARNESTEI